MYNKKIFLFCAFLVVLGGCSNSYLKGNPQIVAEPDKVSALLADAADRASSSLEKLAAIEAQKSQMASVPEMTNVPRELRRGVTINWIGPVEPLLKKLSERASYRFVVFGQEPPSRVIVSVDVENEPIAEVLKDVGLQLGAEAKVHLNAQTRVIELRYDTKFQDINGL
jgi:defect-in-organelle-trafficking protein DotD